MFPLAVLMSSAVGVVLATRRRENPIGWLLLANGLILACSGLAENYAAYAVLDHPGTTGGALAAVIADSIWPLLFAPLAAIAFVFPDGRLPSPRWRPIAIGSLMCLVTMLVAMHFGPRELPAPYDAVVRPLPQLPDAVYAPLDAGLLGRHARRALRGGVRHPHAVCVAPAGWSASSSRCSRTRER